MIHQILRTNRGNVHYWIHRQTDLNNTCLVFTHGLTANHTMFEKQEEFFTNKFTVITWDVSLHGLSYPYTDFSYKNVAEDLNNILCFIYFFFYLGFMVLSIKNTSSKV